MTLPLLYCWWIEAGSGEIAKSTCRTVSHHITTLISFLGHHSLLYKVWLKFPSPTCLGWRSGHNLICLLLTKHSHPRQGILAGNHWHIVSCGIKISKNLRALRILYSNKQPQPALSRCSENNYGMFRYHPSILIFSCLISLYVLYNMGWHIIPACHLPPAVALLHSQPMSSHLSLG